MRIRILPEFLTMRIHIDVALTRMHGYTGLEAHKEPSDPCLLEVALVSTQTLRRTAGGTTWD